MTDIKQICTKLIELWDADCDVDVEINELRAALAEPEPKGPTDEELRQLRRNYEWPVVDSLLFVIARAVLARWGRPAPQPVPVSERLPGAEDCDECGRCWWYGDGEDMVGWTFQNVEGLSYYKATHWLPAHALPKPSRRSNFYVS